MEIEQTIFKQSKSTYYWSSRFLPRAMRDDVFRLYSFVRLADDYTETEPAKKAEFRSLRRAWQKAADDPSFDTDASAHDSIDQRVIKNIVYLTRIYDFDPAWVASFWDSMQADLDGKHYRKLDDMLWYIHGSAEVIGLMMAKIMHLCPEAYQAAALQGRAMRLISFIRDIAEDAEAGRQYFPAEDLARFDLPDLTRETVLENQAAFTKFVQFELSRYAKWQAEAEARAEQDVLSMPRRVRIPLKATTRLYRLTAKQIARDPLVMYIRKIKPSKSQALISGLIAAFRPSS
jgi:phytoene synthase